MGRASWYYHYATERGCVALPTGHDDFLVVLPTPDEGLLVDVLGCRNSLLLHDWYLDHEERAVPMHHTELCPF